ncbi:MULTISPECIES: hypothetical protein [Microbacterium]|uniref:hypothetical protein n=1 Tax=Microbacterium TaxID=33882 RepID=UPI0006F50F3B|nr:MULTISPECIES: hypothetical protein [Microbacterium]KQR38974.1 hypothetical protein ASF80_05830 [Microbacterium sp. Leaf159]
MDVEYLGPTVSAMWLTVALLAGGFARTRNRSALAWFVLTVFLGPIAAFLLVVWPPADPIPSPSPRGADSSPARPSDE